MVYHFYSALDLSAQMTEMWHSTAFGNGAVDFHLKLHRRTANNENNNWPQWNQQRDATTSLLMMRALTSLCTKSSGHLPWNKNHLPDIQRNHDHCQHQAVYLIADWSNMLIRTCCAAHITHWPFGISLRFCDRYSWHVWGLSGMELAKGLTLTVRESQVVIWCRTLSCRIMAANIWHVRLSASCNLELGR